MEILIDTNVALDILLNRRDYANAVAVFDMAENKHITAYISAYTSKEAVKTPNATV